MHVINLGKFLMDYFKNFQKSFNNNNLWNLKCEKCYGIWKRIGEKFNSSDLESQIKIKINRLLHTWKKCQRSLELFGKQQSNKSVVPSNILKKYRNLLMEY